MGLPRSCACAAICAACIVLLSVECAAAEVGRPSGQAFQFGIASNLTLRQFNGTTLSYQRLVGGDMAWRLSVSASARYDNIDHAEEYVAGETTGDTAEEVEWDHSFSVASEWLWYRGSTVSFFFGGGPRVSFSSFQGENSYYYPDGDFWRRYRENGHEFGVGLQGSVGIQWAAARWLAIHAEYGLAFEYRHGVERYATAETGEGAYFEEATETSDEISLSSPGVRFGLSAYF